MTQTIQHLSDYDDTTPAEAVEIATHHLQTLFPIIALCDAQDNSAHPQLIRLVVEAAYLGCDVYAYHQPVYGTTPVNDDADDPASGWVLWLDQRWPHQEGRLPLAGWLAMRPDARDEFISARMHDWLELASERRERGAQRRVTP